MGSLSIVKADIDSVKILRSIHEGHRQFIIIIWLIQRVILLQLCEVVATYSFNQVLHLCGLQYRALRVHELF
jgi:hypothetical protein